MEQEEVFKEGQIENRVEKVEHRGEMITIHKPEGTYSIFYGSHRRKKEVPYKFLEGVGGICLEFVQGEYPRNHEEFIKANRKMQNQTPFLSDKRFSQCMIMADCSIPDIVAGLDIYLPYLELTVATIPLFDKIYRREHKKPCSRRQFLKNIVTATGAAYLSLPSISQLIRAWSSDSGIGERTTARLYKSVQKIHPETTIFVATLRDAVLAQKMYYLLENCGYSHLLAPRGALHVSLEEMVSSEEDERLDFLRRLKPLLLKVTFPKTFYEIKRYGLKNKKWTIIQEFEEPKLKAIIGEK